jgi:hypothetical protein
LPAVPSRYTAVTANCPVFTGTPDTAVPASFGHANGPAPAPPHPATAATSTNATPAVPNPLPTSREATSGLAAEQAQGSLRNTSPGHRCDIWASPGIAGGYSATRDKLAVSRPSERRPAISDRPGADGT